MQSRDKRCTVSWMKRVLPVIALATLAFTFFLCTNSRPFLVSAAENITPLLLSVKDAPVPFVGSDTRTHLVYELAMQNFSSGGVDVEKVEVLGEAGEALQVLSTAAIATRLQPAGFREASGKLAASSSGMLFIHVILPEGSAVPGKLSHRVKIHAEAAPPGMQEITETSGETLVDQQPVVHIGPPLRGGNYISADSCCDATRHTRAALPVNGRVWLGQRFAVDWERMDAEGRIYHGPKEDVKSYAIYGKEVLAVGNCAVVSTVDGMPNQTPGKYPTNIAIDQADGNSVVLDLGGGRFALYAHLQPGSLRVHKGDTVKRGQVIGLVGNTGNSLAPHLHFHVMSTATALAANGLPYAIDSFQVTGIVPGTAEFDIAEEKGTPLPVKPVTPPRAVTNALPLDQLVLSFEP
jgi:hypothetical protein